MKLTQAEKLEQELLAIRQQLMDSFGMSEKHAQEYLEALKLICAEHINDHLRQKQSSRNSKVLPNPC